MNVSTFETASLGVTTLKVKNLEKQDQQIKESCVEFTLVMDGDALAQASHKTGRELMNPNKWRKLSIDEIQTICWCTLRRFHTEMTLDQTRQLLPPGQMGEIADMLWEMTFPGILERVREAISKHENQQLGESQPSTQAQE